eukprot:TRINITY_DN2214_c0_g1_i3.p1 TRINITY_DN2214_c0_g1~~TRINITY_DN2214_c0_g1_i3.p1  ORF type:complete len:700 (-),score=141.81 TRINITY_DN2214_c0_g1_i3:108-2207(-)
MYAANSHGALSVTKGSSLRVPVASAVVVTSPLLGGKFNDECKHAACSQVPSASDWSNMHTALNLSPRYGAVALTPRSVQASAYPASAILSPGPPGWSTPQMGGISNGLRSPLHPTAPQAVHKGWIGTMSAAEQPAVLQATPLRRRQPSSTRIRVVPPQPASLAQVATSLAQSLGSPRQPQAQGGETPSDCRWPSKLLVGGRPPARPKVQSSASEPTLHAQGHQGQVQQSHRLLPLAQRRAGRASPQQETHPRQCPGSHRGQAQGKPEFTLLQVLGHALFSELLAAPCQVSQEALRAAAALAEQAVLMGIDYKSIGMSWEHPTAPCQYREGKHPSIMCTKSRARAQQSQEHLRDAFAKVAQGLRNLEEAVVNAFLLEVGVAGDEVVVQAASFDGVAAALKAELLLPLRCLNEAQTCMLRTYSGQPVPADKVCDTVQAITKAVVSGPTGFSEWRYGCPAGRRQLEGLTAEQAKIWQEPSSLALSHEGMVRTHECEVGDLGLFWATKIGGPSHGFDFEGQCLLPLLANARSKVILVSNPEKQADPVARVHFRFLWASTSASSSLASKQEPRLWLERLNFDYALRGQEVEEDAWTKAVLLHAIWKADAMKVPLSVELHLSEKLKAALSNSKLEGRVLKVSEAFALRPSNGVCEASDFLNDKHDWVQLDDEVTPVRHRALYIPGGLHQSESSSGQSGQSDVGHG